MADNVAQSCLLAQLAYQTDCLTSDVGMEACHLSPLSYTKHIPHHAYRKLATEIKRRPKAMAAGRDKLKHALACVRRSLAVRRARVASPLPGLAGRRLVLL